MKKVKQPHGGSITLAEKGDVLNPSGPPRKLTSKIIADLKADGVEIVTPSNVSDAISVLLNLTLDDLKKIADDPLASILVRRTARRLAAASDRDWDKVISDNLDRAHGRAKQQHEHTGQDGGPIRHDFSGLSSEEMDKMAEIIEKTQSA